MAAGKAEEAAIAEALPDARRAEDPLELEPTPIRRPCRTLCTESNTQNAMLCTTALFCTREKGLACMN
eukprot:1380852-Amphidinium_carterae.1